MKFPISDAAETLEKLKCLCRVDVIELSGGSHNGGGSPKGHDSDCVHETRGRNYRWSVSLEAAAATRQRTSDGGSGVVQWKHVKEAWWLWVLTLVPPERPGKRSSDPKLHLKYYPIKRDTYVRFTLLSPQNVDNTENMHGSNKLNLKSLILQVFHNSCVHISVGHHWF